MVKKNFTRKDLCKKIYQNLGFSKNYSSTIIIDDYNVRPYLHVVENFFDGQIIGRFGVFDKLKEFENINELIEIYSNDPR